MRALWRSLKDSMRPSPLFARWSRGLQRSFRLTSFAKPPFSGAERFRQSESRINQQLEQRNHETPHLVQRIRS